MSERPPTSFDLKKLDSGGVRWTVRGNPEAMSPIIRDPDALLSESATRVAHSELVTMGRVTLGDSQPSTLLLRRLNYGRVRHRLRDTFRRSRAERAFLHGLALERAGVNTPRNLAWGIERRFGIPCRAYLLTDWISSATTLEQMLERDRTLARKDEKRLAALLATLHNAGFSHRDLKASNVIFDQDKLAWLIDLDGVRPLRGSGRVRAMADLARFAWEFAAYPGVLKWGGRRFLRDYCALRGWDVNRRELERKLMQPTLDRLRTGTRHWKRGMRSRLGLERARQQRGR